MSVEMNLTEAINKRKEMEAKVTQKAMEDSEFRAKLLEDPKAALAEFGGKAVPDGISVNIVEEKPNTVTIVVPPTPAQFSENAELSDDALENIAGGAIVHVSVVSLFS